MKAFKAIGAAVFLMMSALAIAEQKSPAGTTKEKEAAYEKAVQKCNVQGGAEKQKCIEDAKEKYGEMLK